MSKTINIAEPYLGDKEFKSLQEPLKNGWLTQGPRVADFETKFGNFHSVKYAVAVSNCTTALHLALIACGIGAGDEVIVPAFTWIATANVVEYIGAKPVFVDIEIDTFNIDCSKIEAKITAKTKAIIPVHLFGLCADMDAVNSIAEKYNLKVVEDAACASGALYKNKFAGSLGDVACFSFHPRKVITTGEGGMLTTDNADIAEKVSMLRSHGASVSEEMRHHGNAPYIMPDFAEIGFNYRMTDLQASVGCVQVDRLQEIVSWRRKNARIFAEMLSGISWLKTPLISEDHSYQSFVCYIKDFKFKAVDLMAYLQAKGVSSRPGTINVAETVFYKNKYNLNMQDFSATRYAADYSIALPFHNNMTDVDFEYIFSVIKDFSA